MSEFILQEVLNRLDNIGNITADAVKEIIPMASRYILAIGITQILFALVLFGIVIGGWVWYRKHHEKDADGSGAVMLTMFTMFGLPMGFYFGYQGIVNIIAREWRTIELLIDKIK